MPDRLAAMPMIPPVAAGTGAALTAGAAGAAVRVVVREARVVVVAAAGAAAGAGAGWATLVMVRVWGAPAAVVAAESSWAGAAEAGSANVATRPPEATATADTFMAGCAERAAMSAISDSGL